MKKVKRGLRKDGLLIIKEVYLADLDDEAHYLTDQKRIFLTEKHFESILRKVSADFLVLNDLKFEPSRKMLPEKFLILKRK